MDGGVYWKHTVVCQPRLNIISLMRINNDPELLTEYLNIVMLCIGCAVALWEGLFETNTHCLFNLYLFSLFYFICFHFLCCHNVPFAVLHTFIYIHIICISCLFSFYVLFSSYFVSSPFDLFHLFCFYNFLPFLFHVQRLRS